MQGAPARLKRYLGTMRNEDHPPIDCPHRGCARGRRDYEQRLQEQPSRVVRSDVHRTPPHTNWVEVIVASRSISTAPEQLRAPLMNCPVRTSSFLVVVATVIGLIGLCPFAKHVQAQANAPPAVAPAPRLKLTTEQEFIIREIVLKDLNVQKENSAPETIGDSVPDDVKLYPLPPEVIQKVPQAQAHQFFVKNDEVVLVSSSDRRVADVIKKKPTD
jgi:hypothetical protein